MVAYTEDDKANVGPVYGTSNPGELSWLSYEGNHETLKLLFAILEKIQGVPHATTT